MFNLVAMIIIGDVFEYFVCQHEQSGGDLEHVLWKHFNCNKCPQMHAIKLIFEDETLAKPILFSPPRKS
jgi:hypothetical protein